MEKRTILAIALSFLILICFDFVYKKYFAPPKPQEPVENVAAGPESPLTATAETQSKTEPVYELTASDADTAAAGPQEIIVDTDLYHAVLDNKGGVVSSWILKNYLSSGEPENRREFDMIAASDKGELWSRPGSLYFESESVTAIANNELYEVTVNGVPYSGFALSPPVDVVMTLRRGDIAIQKTYKFHKDNYTVGLSATFQQDGKELKGKFFLGQDIGPIEEYIKGRYTDLKAKYYDGKKVRSESAPDEEDGTETKSGNIQWVGLDMHYFTAIAIPEKTISSFEIRGYETTTELYNKDTLDRKLLSIKIPADGSLDCLLYLGPKEPASLKAVPKYDLSGVIDYGMFSVIARPLLYALRWIHQYVNNYGFAIILLTLLLSLLLLPLRIKQMFSMKKMQTIQPKVKAIQERYKKYKKTDPKKAEMNQEIMALYRENKVNPMGGCLPLLVQMPLLFAFYSLLANSIELRQAPFIFWINDLSAMDPKYVLPILMGLTMFVSQKITPMAPTADNSQAKMMQFLPVVFTIMFFKVSSGLNLYFLCSNIFQVGFQKVYELILGDKKNDRKPKRKK